MKKKHHQMKKQQHHYHIDIRNSCINGSFEDEILHLNLIRIHLYLIPIYLCTIHLYLYLLCGPNNIYGKPMTPSLANNRKSTPNTSYSFVFPDNECIVKMECIY
eukprot:346306_1